MNIIIDIHVTTHRVQPSHVVLTQTTLHNAVVQPAVYKWRTTLADSDSSNTLPM